MQPQERQDSSVPEIAAPAVRVLMPSPIGELGVELTGPAVTRLRIAPGEAERTAFTPLHQITGSDFLDEVFGRLSEYFAGARRKLDLHFDLAACGLHGLARRVLREASKIPYGKTRSVHAVADGIGLLGGERQVLAILLENPLPILIPCHRVIDRDGIGGYVGGSERKRWLLDLERQDAELF
jgi:methylated-DNA-[protein]-cysteine S-methyltransferase